MTQQTLVIATHNQGKVKEFVALLGGDNLKVMAAGDFSIPEPEETGDSFTANADLKTIAVRDWFARHRPDAMPDFILADDSGLSVPLLGGAPGIFSARWAGRDKDFSVAIQRVKKELLEKNIAEEKINTPTVPAYFSCALSLWVQSAKKLLSVVGTCHGYLQFPPRGQHGFGYDPIFIPEQEIHTAQRTFGEMLAAEKDKISHRSQALQLLTKACLDAGVNFPAVG